jgi:hypothetical protein
MADIHKFSERMIDYAERLSNVADAAQGKRMARRGNGISGWLLLPAAGAGLYAMVRSEFFSRQAKEVVDEAKTRASELPADLMKSVRQTRQGSRRQTTQNTAKQSPGSASGRGSQKTRRRRTTGTQRRRQTSSARKTTAGR